MKKKEEKRSIPSKNYLVLIVIFIAVILLTVYINAWIKTYKEQAYSTSVLSGMINEININEINEPLMEVNELILYVGYTDDQKLFNNEKKLLNSIQEKELNSYVMYLNVKDNKDYKKVLRDKFADEDNKVKEAPLFIFIRNGEVKKIVNVKNKNDLTKDFNNIVEKYNVGDDY